MKRSHLSTILLIIPVLFVAFSSSFVFADELIVRGIPTSLPTFHTIEELEQLSKYTLKGTVIGIKQTTLDEKTTQPDNQTMISNEVTIKVRNELQDQHANETIKFRIDYYTNLDPYSKSVNTSLKFQTGENVTVFLTGRKSESGFVNSYAGFIVNKYVLSAGIAYDVTSVKQPPPLKQHSSGVLARSVNCNEGLELIIKANNGQPVCVKPETKVKLIERGWAESQVTSIGQTLNSIKEITPTAVIVKQKLAQVGDIALTIVGKTTTSHFEHGQVSNIHEGLAQMTLSHGVSSDGQDIVVATITNTSKEKFHIKKFGLGGETDLQISALGTLAIDSDYESSVSQYVPTSKEAVVLNPDESLSAYIKGKWVVDEINQPITKFGGTILFYFDKDSKFYDDGHNWAIAVSSQST